MSNFNISDKEIQALAYNKKVYDLGVAYMLNKKVSGFSFMPEKNLITAEVTGNWYYDVNINLNRDGSVHSYYCSCPAYEGYPGACKHIVAVLKTAQRKLSQSDAFLSDAKRAASDFMAIFTKHKQDYLQEELTLSLELQINIGREISAQLQLRIGTSRLYVVKDLQELLSAIKTERTLEFGMKFTYDPTRHVFKEEDKPIIAMLQEMLEQYDAFDTLHGSSYYYTSPFRQKPFTLSRYYLGMFLEALGNKDFILIMGSSKTEVVHSSHSTRVIRQGIPLDFSVKAKGHDIMLDLNNALPFQLTADGRYYIYNQEIYLASPQQQEFLPNLIKVLSGKNRSSILFPAESKDIFASEALPFIEKVGSVSIESQLAQRFIKEELQTKIYFDRVSENGISARLEFHYGDRIINPFSAKAEIRNTSPENDHIFIRDIDLERKILNIFEQAEFIVSQGKISLEEDEQIFDFTVNGLPQLQEWAETFYSDDFKLKIRTTTSFSGRIRLDESSDILEISFQYSDIDQTELADIFYSLQMKKKYYRLRDGSFLDLKQPELASIAALMEHLDIKGDALSNSTLHLPKYRSMYIDSFLRQANLPGIQRDKAFKLFVQSILEPQDGEFEPPTSLTNILRDYQKTGFKWLKTLSNYGLGGILADDMGLGKTLEVLAFILSEKPSASAPSLVIAPTSLVYNWQSEGVKFAPELNILVLEGTPQEREALMATIDQFDLVVVSYAVLRRDIERFCDLDFLYCFLDEAQNIKNPQTLNAKSVQRIKAKGYFALTGTPIENSLAELWSLFHFFMPGYLLSHQEFHKKYAVPISKGDSEALLELSRHTKPFILRRLKKDVLKELPPKIETEMNASLTEEQRKVYLAYLQQTKSQIAQDLATSGFAKSQIKILAALTRLRQICAHPAMFIENYTGESGKMLLFQEILTDALAGGHRVLVFSQFTSMLDIIRDDLISKNISYFYLSGATKARERSQMANAFNNGQGDVFLISLKAGGTGLNLTGADTVIHFDPWWNPAVEDQATDRAHRIGQNRSVQVIKLLTKGTIEEKVNALQSKKKKLIDSIIQPGETMLTKLTEQELKELFEID